MESRRPGSKKVNNYMEWSRNSPGLASGASNARPRQNMPASTPQFATRQSAVPKLKQRSATPPSNDANENLSNTDTQPSDNQEELMKGLEKQQLKSALGALERPPLCCWPCYALCCWLPRFLCPYKLKIRVRYAEGQLHFGTLKLMKENIIGLLSGLLIGFLAFALFLFTFSYNPHLSTIVSAYLMLLGIFGIAFSADVRCIACLTIPYLAASRVRWLLLIYATTLAATGPGLNFLHNSGNFRNSIACILGQVSTNLILLQKLTAAPFGLLKNQLDTIIDSLNVALQRLRSALSFINLSMIRITTVIERQNNWIRSLVEACGDQTALENQCLAFFNNIFFNCKASMGAFDFVCTAVRMFAVDTCKNVESLNELCDRQAEVLQDTVNITSVANLTKKLDRILELIGKGNLTLEGNFDEFNPIRIESDQTVAALLHQRMDTFIEMIEHAKIIISWVMVLWTLATMLQMVIQAAMFRRMWLTKDTFDNFYVTQAFIEQERRAVLQNLVPTVPLVRKERHKYKTLTSFTWATSEKRKAFGSGLFLISWMVSLLMMLFADYAIYQVVRTVAPIFSNRFSSYGGGRQTGREYDSDESNTVSQPVLHGGSSFANIGRAFVGMLNPMKDIALDVDAVACRPEALPPNDRTNLLVGLMIVLTTLSILFQVYVMRLRHAIMIWYYPSRAVQRAAWLRTHIRNNRGLFHRLVHKFRTVDLTPGRRKGKVSWFGRKLIRFPTLRKVFEFIGIRRIMCAYCGQEGNPAKKAIFKTNFTQCPECGAFYCKTCQSDLESICMLCKTPLFAMAVEVDFEEIASEEEFEAICAQYLRRSVKNTAVKRALPSKVSSDLDRPKWKL